MTGARVRARVKWMAQERNEERPTLMLFTVDNDTKEAEKGACIPVYEEIRIVCVAWR